MITGALDAVDEEFTGTSPLKALRVYAMFCYQFFPAIYFAAYDGLLPTSAAEPLWSICDWCLKMVMTNSLMDANFLTIEQRVLRARMRQLSPQTEMDVMQLSAAVAAQGACRAARFVTGERGP